MNVSESVEVAGSDLSFPCVRLGSSLDEYDEESLTSAVKADPRRWLALAPMLMLGMLSLVMCICQLLEVKPLETHDIDEISKDAVLDPSRDIRWKITRYTLMLSAVALLVCIFAWFQVLHLMLFQTRSEIKKILNRETERDMADELLGEAHESVMRVSTADVQQPLLVSWKLKLHQFSEEVELDGSLFWTWFAALQVAEILIQLLRLVELSGFHVLSWQVVMTTEPEYILAQAFTVMIESMAPVLTYAFNARIYALIFHAIVELLFCFAPVVATKELVSKAAWVSSLGVDSTFELFAQCVPMVMGIAELKALNALLARKLGKKLYKNRRREIQHLKEMQKAIEDWQREVAPLDEPPRGEPQEQIISEIDEGALTQMEHPHHANEVESGINHQHGHEKDSTKTLAKPALLQPDFNFIEEGEQRFAEGGFVLLKKQSTIPPFPLERQANVLFRGDTLSLCSDLSRKVNEPHDTNLIEVGVNVPEVPDEIYGFSISSHAAFNPHDLGVIRTTMGPEDVIAQSQFTKSLTSSVRETENRRYTTQKTRSITEMKGVGRDAAGTKRDTTKKRSGIPLNISALQKTRDAMRTTRSGILPNTPGMRRMSSLENLQSDVRMMTQMPSDHRKLYIVCVLLLGVSFLSFIIFQTLHGDCEILSGWDQCVWGLHPIFQFPPCDCRFISSTVEGSVEQLGGGPSCPEITEELRSFPRVEYFSRATLGCSDSNSTLLALNGLQHLKVIYLHSPGAMQHFVLRDLPVLEQLVISDGTHFNELPDVFGSFPELTSLRFEGSNLTRLPHSLLTSPSIREAVFTSTPFCSDDSYVATLPDFIECLP